MCDEYSDLADTIFDTVCVRGRLNVVEIREMWFINRMNTGFIEPSIFHCENAVLFNDIVLRHSANNRNNGM